MRLECPICGEVRQLDPEREADKELARHRPFCSARCKLVDLGNWLDERYRIPGPPGDTELN